MNNPKPPGRPVNMSLKRAHRLSFPCRKCSAVAGEICRSPSGSPVNPEHADRFAQAAADLEVSA